MTKRSPCQFGLAPRGDLPTAFEVGSRAPSPQRGQGAGVPQTLPPPPPACPQVRSSAGTGPQAHGDMATGPLGWHRLLSAHAEGGHRSGGTRSRGAWHPRAVHRHPHPAAPGAPTCALRVAPSPNAPHTAPSSTPSTLHTRVRRVACPVHAQRHYLYSKAYKHIQLICTT